MSTIAHSLTRRDAQASTPDAVPQRVAHRTYDGFDFSISEIRYPKSEADLRRAVVRAGRDGRRIVVRGAGLSLDRQSASHDLTICTARLTHLVLDIDAARITVGPGVTWGTVLSTTAPHGLVPGAMPTEPSITVGGTLSTNALSRFSSAHGQEAAWVECLRLMCLDGRVLHCSRTENADIFRGVIGGLGKLGIVVSVTYRLLRREVGVQVLTHLVKQRGIDGIEADLMPDPDAPEEAMCVALCLGRDGLKQMRCRSRYTAGEPLAPLVLHTGVTPFRKAVELGLQFLPFMARALWNIGYHFALKDQMRLVDDLHGYTFFMQPNTWAHRRLAQWGMVMRVLEQTWVVPVGRLEAFLDDLVAACRSRKLDPALFDVCYLPPEPDSLLASAPDGGFAVNIAFTHVTDRRGKADRVRSLFHEVTEICAAAGGIVHLTKNVFGDPATIRRMYGDRLDRFRALAARLDPGQQLGSDFFDRVFGPAAPSDRVCDQAV